MTNLVLLLGVAFLLLVVGTLLGRYYSPDRRPLQRAAEEGRAYVRGLVEVVEGHQDQAIAEIAEALKKNTRTVEAYFALGTLFRSRGEHERAVRVHQALLMRRDLDKATRLRVHYQLALDFKAAGFPRRAARALELVVTQDRKQVEPLEELARLYQQAGEWEKAALAERRVARLSGRDTSSLQAHLYAQLAEQELAAGDLDGARRALKRAVAAQRDSVHALHVLAIYHQRKGQTAAAAAAWEKALRLAPDLAGFFVPHLEKLLFELDKLPQLDRLLDELRAAHPASIHLRLAHARVDAKRSPERALAALDLLLGEAPNLIPAWREKARLVLAGGNPERIRQTFEELTGLLAKADRGYRCRTCGHTVEELFWRCASCGSWDSVRTAWGRRAGEGTPGPSRRAA
jgi:lipopolysaccharide biosynthesis regulator YciM